MSHPSDENTDPIGPAEIGLVGWSASPGQQRLWVFQRMYPRSTAYYLVGRLRVPEGDNWDESRLRNVGRLLAMRHPALRSVFHEVGSELRQRVEADLHPSFFSSQHLAHQAALEPAIKAFVRAPFDLARGPLFRVLSVSGPGDDRHLVWVVHHMVCDGASLVLMSQQASALIDSVEHDDREASASASDYAQAVSMQHQSVDRAAGKRFWQQMLADLPQRLELPCDNPHNAELPSPSASYGVALEEGVATRLKAFCYEAGSTPFQVLMAAFVVMLHKLSGRDDLLIGMPVSGRTLNVEERIICKFERIFC